MRETTSGGDADKKRTMAMITPTRLGLKYGPVPTLALEYEEDLGVVETDDGTRSLYVFKESAGSEPGGGARRVRKKLHVVELPQLHGTSEPLAVVRQLQKDNHKFLGPSVVKEQQLQRLLQQLVDHLPATRGGGVRDAARDDVRGSDVRGSERVEPVARPAAATTREDAQADDADEDEEQEQRRGESGMEDLVAEALASGSLDTSRREEDVRRTDRSAENTSTGPVFLHRTGKFITQEDSDGDDQEDAEKNGRQDSDQDGVASSPPKSTTASPMNEEDLEEAEEDLEEAEEDAKKTKALKSESDASEEEDDVQSEELEYFSEDGSDEDSF